MGGRFPCVSKVYPPPSGPNTIRLLRSVAYKLRWPLLLLLLLLLLLGPLQ
jgi:hypothetical protein